MVEGTIMATRDDRTNAPPLLGYHNILVWVGCRELAERACELAAAMARPGAPVTLGVPIGEDELRNLDRLVRHLTETATDVRVVPLPDRQPPTLGRVAREGAHDLVIHADRDGPRTVSEARLREICPCPVWIIRGPSEPAPEDSRETDFEAA